jgi:hypothetical protein
MIPPLFGKQEVGIWRVKKRFPRYGVPLWSLWPNIRFLPSIVAEKNATKNILDGRKDRRTEVKQYTPLGIKNFKTMSSKIVITFHLLMLQTWNLHQNTGNWIPYILLTNVRSILFIIMDEKFTEHTGKKKI